ncbi:MAG: hypothetical protein NWE91_05110 [Candidatus Bathyarchaeota archaeon]|nr:hypothetical protein [Candidatus Bathyarchaeota archaeon]
MKYSAIVLVNLLAIILAIVVVWVYARESFEFVVFLLALYFLWVVARLILQEKKLRKEKVAGAKEAKISMHLLGQTLYQMLIIRSKRVANRC